MAFGSSPGSFPGEKPSHAERVRVMANDAGLRVPTAKICRNCSRFLPLEEFPRNERQHFGRGSWCRDCAREATRDWRRRNPELMSWMNKQRRLGEREKDCLDCGQPFTYKNSLAARCPDCRHKRKLEQRRAVTRGSGQKRRYRRAPQSGAME
jgi:DNA-directed RNA polymerase subunit RPC12/RpoP